jgi:hypothetical protein
MFRKRWRPAVSDPTPTADDLAREYVEAVSERKYPGSLPNLAALDGFKAGYAAGFAAAVERAADVAERHRRVLREYYPEPRELAADIADRIRKLAG